MNSQVGEQLRWALQPIQHILDDPTITDIHLHGAQGPDTPVFVKRQGKRERMTVNLSRLQLDAIAQHAAVLNRSQITERMPSSPGRFPDGQRAHIVLASADAEDKTAISIRRTSAVSPSPEDLRRFGVFEKTVAAEHAPEREGVRELLAMKDAGATEAFLSYAFANGFSGVFCGVVNSGKTYNMRAFFRCIPEDKRIITIQDMHELPGMPQEDVVHMIYPKGSGTVAQHTAENCLEWALRMDMDEIVNGEVRDGAAWALMRAGASGHPFKTTCHASSALGAFDALLMMAKQHPDAKTLDTDDIRQSLRMLIDFVAYCEVVDGKRRITQLWFDPHSKKGMAKQLMKEAA